MATSMEQLVELCKLPDKLLQQDRRRLALTMERMVNAAESCDRSNDREKAFVLYMRFADLCMLLSRNIDVKQYKKLPSSHRKSKERCVEDLILGLKSRVAIAISRAECLKKDLKDMYSKEHSKEVKVEEVESPTPDTAAISEHRSPVTNLTSLIEIKESCDSDNDDNSPEEPLSSSADLYVALDVGTTGLMQPTSFTVPMNIERQDDTHMWISALELYELTNIIQGKHLLVFDVRPWEKFRARCMTTSALIHLSPSVLLPNITEEEAAQGVTGTVGHDFFANRMMYDHVVLICDRSDVSESTSAVFILYELFDKWCENPLKRPARILIGGFDAWMQRYPTLCQHFGAVDPVTNASHHTTDNVSIGYPLLPGDIRASPGKFAKVEANYPVVEQLAPVKKKVSVDVKEQNMTERLDPGSSNNDELKTESDEAHKSPPLVDRSIKILQEDLQVEGLKPKENTSSIMDISPPIIGVLDGSQSDLESNSSLPPLDRSLKPQPRTSSNVIHDLPIVDRNSKPKIELPERDSKPLFGSPDYMFNPKLQLPDRTCKPNLVSFDMSEHNDDGVLAPSSPPKQSTLKPTANSKATRGRMYIEDDDDIRRLRSRSMPPIDRVPLSPSIERPVPPVPQSDRSKRLLKKRASNHQFVEQHMSPTYGGEVAGITGLRNLGNTCYMNCILQCLATTMPLVSYFNQNTHFREINTINKLGHRGELAKSYAQVIKAMWSGHLYRVISPAEFKYCIGRLRPDQYGGMSQQDCQELLSFVIDGLHEDLNRVKERVYIEFDDNDVASDSEAALRSWKYHLRVNNSVIVDFMQGQFKTTLTCNTCNHTSRKFSAFTFLSLPVPIHGNSAVSLSDCLNLFFRPSHLKGNEQWYCGHCKTHRDAIQRIQIWRLPHILLIHLKRFQSQGSWRSKIDTRVDYPANGLDFSGDILGACFGSESKLYDLYAVACHYGGLDGGHYTAITKHALENKWYRFDDSHVTPASSAAMHTAAAYMLFYTSINFREFSLVS